MSTQPSITPSRFAKEHSFESHEARYLRAWGYTGQLTNAKISELIVHFAERFARGEPFEYQGYKLDSVRVIEILGRELKRRGGDGAGV